MPSHSDGTHSLQWIHWWANDVMLNLSKSVPINKKHIYILDSLRVIHFQKIVILGWIIPLRHYDITVWLSVKMLWNNVYCEWAIQINITINIQSTHTHTDLHESHSTHNLNAFICHQPSCFLKKNPVIRWIYNIFFKHHIRRDPPPYDCKALWVYRNT